MNEIPPTTKTCFQALRKLELLKITHKIRLKDNLKIKQKDLEINPINNKNPKHIK